MRENETQIQGSEISSSSRSNEALEEIFSKYRSLSNADIQALATAVSKKQKTGRVLLAGTIIGAGLTIAGFYAKEAFADQPPPEPTPASRDLSSFENNNGPQLVADQENPLGIPEEIVPVIDPKNPDKINLLFPIELAPGSENREIKIERGVDWMGGGARHNIGSDDQSVGKFAVKNAFIIKDGLKDGDILRAPINGTTRDGLAFKGEDEFGNEYTIMMGLRSKLEYIKEIPKTESIKIGPGRYGWKEEWVPIKKGEAIAIIRDPSKGIIGPGGSGGFGQMYIYTFSTVQLEDGTKQQGAADIVVRNLPPNTDLPK